MSLLPRFLCLLLLLGLPACSSFGNMFRKKSPTDKRVGQAKVIGVIEMVNPEQNYVLINCEGRLDIPAGTEIISQGSNGTDAKLKVTPERKGNYITADIVQGTPQLRDLVLYQVRPGTASAAAAAAGIFPASPSTTAAAPVVPLTPVMQADVIPPLDTPFQPMTPVRPAPLPELPPLRQQAPSQPQSQPPFPLPPPRSQQQATEPEADLSKLPPVIR